MAGTYVEVVKDKDALLPNGDKQIWGTVKIGTYYSGDGSTSVSGTGMNLANFYPAGGSVSVVFSRGSSYCKHDGGNASNGRVICYTDRWESNTLNTFVQITNNYDMSTANIGFTAVGKSL